MNRIWSLGPLDLRRWLTRGIKLVLAAAILIILLIAPLSAIALGFLVLSQASLLEAVEILVGLGVLSVAYWGAIIYWPTEMEIEIDSE